MLKHQAKIDDYFRWLKNKRQRDDDKLIKWLQTYREEDDKDIIIDTYFDDLGKML